MKRTTRNPPEQVAAIQAAAVHHLNPARRHFKIATSSSREGIEDAINEGAALGYTLHSLHLSQKPAALGGGSASPLHYVAVLEMAAQ